MIEIDGRLLLGIQKGDGRLAIPSRELLTACDYGFGYRGNGQQFSRVRNASFDLRHGRDDDIPIAVDTGRFDLGIVGLDMVYESGANVTLLKELDFAECRLVIASSPGFTLETLRDSIENTRALEEPMPRVATKYMHSAGAFFNERGIKGVDLYKVGGSVEAEVATGKAIAIVDLTSTGDTLTEHSLVEVETVYPSRAALIGNWDQIVLKGGERLVEDLVFRIEAVMAGRASRLVKLNAPVDKIEFIQEVLDGLKAPSVLDLLGRDDYKAMEAVVPGADIYGLMRKLKAVGAEDILVQPLQLLVP